MKIDLTDVMAKDGSVYPFEYPLDLSKLDIQGEFPFAEPLTVCGNVTNRAGMLELKINIDTHISYKCARCAADTSREYHADIFHVLSADGDKSDIDDVFPIEGTEVDVDSAVISGLILDYDMVNLCKPDCKGLCPICGCDLNKEKCSCSVKDEDSRLSPLRELLDKMKNE